MPVLHFRDVKTTSIPFQLLTVTLRALLVFALFVPGWLIYRSLPYQPSANRQATNRETSLQIVLRPHATSELAALDISVELYPFDIIAVRHEYFTERRAGKRFDDFLNERMKGRSPVAAKLDKQGQTSVVLSEGSWWLHAQFYGDENIEWRLPISVAGRKQTIELTEQNVYTRTKSF